MPALFAAILATAALAQTPPAAPTDAFQYLHPRATIVAGLNVKQAADSPVFKMLLKEIGGDSWQSKLTAEGLGFVHSIDRVVLSTPGLPSSPRRPNNPGARQEPPMVIAVQGDFDLAGLRSAVSQKGARFTKYNGIEIADSAETPGDLLLAVISPRLLVLADKSSIYSALDRAQAHKPLQPRAAALAAQYELWFVSDAPPSQLPSADLAPALQILRDVQSFEGGLSLRDALTVDLHLEASTEKAATDLANAARVMIPLVTSSAAANDAQVKQLIQDLRIAANNRRVTFSLSVPQQQIQAAIRKRRGPGGHDGPSPTAMNNPSKSKRMVVKIQGLEEGPREITLPPR